MSNWTLDPLLVSGLLVPFSLIAIVVCNWLLLSWSSLYVTFSLGSNGWFWYTSISSTPSIWGASLYIDSNPVGVNLNTTWFILSGLLTPSS